MKLDGTVALADDDRARIPFAMIGVLLLVGSVALTGAMESRPDPEPEIDATLAMDRTSAASQTALRDAVLRASDRAALAPITKPADTPYGSVLGDETTDSDEVFENYLRILIYLEARDSLSLAGQEIRGAGTTVSLPPVDDAASLEDAMNRVTIDEPEPGLLTVEIEGVTIALERDGEELATRTRTIEVTVATTLLQLHETVAEYERELNRGVFTDGGGVAERGFGRQFNARMYPIAWTRGYAQYAGVPVSEVVANRHVELFANDAVFATQRSVFGATDPHEENAMRRAWGCLAAKDAQELYSGTYDEDPETLDAEEICTGLEYVYGDVDGELPPAPTGGDLVGAAPGMDDEMTIGVNQTADLAFRGLLDESNENSLESAFDRIHTVEVEADHRVREREAYTPPEPDRPPVEDLGNWSLVSTKWTNESVVDVSTDDSRTYDRFEGTVTTTYERTDYWENTSENATDTPIEQSDSTDASFSFVVSISGEHSPDAAIDEGFDRRGMATEYETGGRVPFSEPSYTLPGGYESADPSLVENYAEQPAEATRTLVGSESQLAEEIEDAATDATSAHEIESGISIRRYATLEADRLPGLEAWVVADLISLRNELRGEEVTFETKDLLTGNPVQELHDEIAENKAEYVDPPATYDDVPDKVRYEARLAYVDLLLDDLRTVADAHEQTKGGVEDELDDEIDTLNGGIEQLTTLAQETLTEEPPAHEGSIPNSPLLDDVTFEIAGSPTYLSIETVEREQVTAVEPGTTHAPMAAKNTNYFAIPYNRISSNILDRFFDSDDDEVVTLRTAAEMLATARIAERTTEDLDLSEERSELRGAIQDSLEAEIRDEIAASVAEGFDAIDEEDVVDIVDEELDGYGSTGEQAIAVTSGRALDDVPVAIAENADLPDDTEYGSDVWRAKVESVARIGFVDSTEEIVVDGGKGPVKEINEKTRSALEEKADEVIDERLANGTRELEEKWMEGRETPNRVPAGMPITPVPGYWFATANVWDVDVTGEYARFAVKANSGSPATAGTTTYVRQNDTVSIDIDGSAGEREIGHTESISFTGQSVILVVVPPGKTGVGDRTGDTTECSETWPVSGAIEDESEISGCSEQ